MIDASTYFVVYVWHTCNFYCWGIITNACEYAAYAMLNNTSNLSAGRLVRVVWWQSDIYSRALLACYWLASSITAAYTYSSLPTILCIRYVLMMYNTAGRWNDGTLILILCVCVLLCNCHRAPIPSHPASRAMSQRELQDCSPNILTIWRVLIVYLSV
jgi:hypothetical protein